MHGDNKKNWWKSALPNCQPQTRVLTAGYDPDLSEMSAKVPIFPTSTFLFRTAEDGERFFYLQNNPDKRTPGDDLGLIYSRMNNPNMEIVEDKMLTQELGAEAAAVLPSGMSAISTMCLALLKPGDYIIYSAPVYGGTEHFFHDILSKFGIHAIPVYGPDPAEYKAAIDAHKDNVAMVFIETPANPTMAQTDIEAIVQLAKKYKSANGKVLVVSDNTFLGPVFQHPFQLGVDLVVYSATKFLGGHSDLIGGFVLGGKDLLTKVKSFRSVVGATTDPFCCWLISRSLETVELRMRKCAENAMQIAEFLVGHPNVTKVIYPGLLKENDPQCAIFKKQCSGPGSLISFYVKGGKKEAFEVLNHVKICRLAVSLGGTETLIEHPRRHTHASVPEEMCQKVGLTDSMIRISIGLEAPIDLIEDLNQALNRI
ncbi:MAG TPA: methionine gamma-lyase [candidate division Zixibacteria bacterium]|nr:methionine gamma-lyase [candidate division Zixibacteria bacterium]